MWVKTGLIAVVEFPLHQQTWLDSMDSQEAGKECKKNDCTQ
jgi:hypothetical protein